MITNVKDEINDVFEFFGHPQLVNYINVEFCNRMNVAAASASYIKKQIKISSKYWNFASDTDKIETLRHEACHIVDSYRHQKGIAKRNIYMYNRTQGHEDVWKNLMIELGYRNPNPYHCYGYSFGNRCKYNCQKCKYSSIEFSVRRGNLYMKQKLVKCPKCGEFDTPNSTIQFLKAGEI